MTENNNAYVGLEMKTIGYRKEGVSVLYILTLIIGIAFFIGGIFLVSLNNKDGLFEIILVGFISGLVMIGISIYELASFYSTDERVICVNEDKISVNGNKFLIKDIIDVSYKEARSRYATYKYGKIIIRTKDITYCAKNVANCEMVSKTITKLMYEKKNSNLN